MLLFSERATLQIWPRSSRGALPSVATSGTPADCSPEQHPDHLSQTPPSLNYTTPLSLCLYHEGKLFPKNCRLASEACAQERHAVASVSGLTSLHSAISPLIVAVFCSSFAMNHPLRPYRTCTGRHSLLPSFLLSLFSFFRWLFHVLPSLIFSTP